MKNDKDTAAKATPAKKVKKKKGCGCGKKKTQK